MRNVIGFMVGIIFGSLVGASLALLLTPLSGNEMRGQIQERTKNLTDEIKLAAQTRREELEKQLEELRAPKRPGDIQVQ
jgi:gas vesicle protein